jgi:tetratricopeptide (TPR) repeat protein/predicted Ser/Thr protein kinase
VAGFVAQPSGESLPEITPYDETVRVGKPTDRRPKSEPTVPDEALAAPPTARFGKFIRTLRLGAGGMGEVWKAWDSVLGRWVALKFLKGGDDEEIARFRREAQTAGRLHHAHIAAIYEVNEDQGRQYIAMQFVDGQNLHQFPRTDRALLVRLVVDAARALHYAHEQGVIHRDLKPENLMVTRRGTEHHVFLMDFGLARIAEGASKISATGYLVGTPMYMSPEQARGEKVDVRSDIYSLGLTLYELLTDAKPFESESVYETLRMVQEKDPLAPRQLNRRIAEDLETIVMKAIAKDPISRYATARELADDLQAYLQGDAIRGKRESIHRKLIRRVRRHPFAFATGAVLLLGLATSGVILSRASREREVTELSRKLETALQVPEWTDAHLRGVQDRIADLASVAPQEAGAFRERLPKALAASIRAAELTLARSELPLLERLDPAEAMRIAAELGQRERMWPPVFKLEAPFSNETANAVFEAATYRIEGGALHGNAPGAMRTKKPCEGNVELKAEFDGPWREASQIGLLFGAGDPSGYQFLMMTAEGATPPSFQAVRDAKGAFRLQIRRGDMVLREQLLESEPINLNAPLRLVARREGDLLMLQVNDLPQMGFRDPFGLGTRQRGAFGLVWPSGVSLRRLLATHQELPLRPSLLDVADGLFLDRKFEEALDRYSEAARSAAAVELRSQALYKQALCALLMNRAEDARKMLESLAAGFITATRDEEKYWYFLADCQLLLIYFRDPEGVERAALILNKLGEYKYDFEKLSLLMPPDIQRQILNSVQFIGFAANLHRRPEEYVAQTELALQASELLEPPQKRGEYKYHHLMRAYMAVDRPVEAMRTAEKFFRIYKPSGEMLDDYCWILRLSSDPDDLPKAKGLIDRAAAADPVHLVERARVRAALKDWAGALQDVDTFLQKPLDYHSFSGACLLRGFLLEQEGAAREQVEEAWRRGLLKNWPNEGPQKVDAADLGRSLMGMPMLHNWIMSSLLGDLSDAEAEQLLAGLMSFAGKDNPVFNKLMRPAVLRATWRTPRARQVARHVALRDLPFSMIARYPLFLGWIEFVHEVCFNAAEPLSSEQDELLWQMSGEIFTAYREGTLTDRYFLPFGAIVAGNPHAPGMGWREVAILLEKSPKLRGPLAYIFGRRYLKKGDPKTAAMFFRSAAADADREPAQPPLKRLAQVELDALK